jgi:hypothetical protein
LNRQRGTEPIAVHRSGVALRLSRQPESLGRQVREDDERHSVHPQRNLPRSEQRRPLENQPGQMAECDKREDDAGNEQECLLSHEVPPFCKGVSSSFGGIVILRARKRGGTYTSGSSRSHVEAAKNDKTPEIKIPSTCPKCSEPFSVLHRQF